MANLIQMEAAAKANLVKALKTGSKPLVAFSGGKDSIVVAHMANQLGVSNYVCETSFYFDKQLQSIKSIANHLGINPVYKNSLDLAWLYKNRDLIFSSDTKRRAWSFSVRQQRTVKRQAKLIGAGIQIFGRRTEENSVKAAIYQTEHGLQCHPIRDWREQDVWEYFYKYGIPIPFIYSTEFGKIEGNAPFYTLNSKNCGGVNAAWKICSSIDPRYNEEMFNVK